MTKPRAPSTSPPQSPTSSTNKVESNLRSDEVDAAVTVAHTVMAEQISHNVVNNSESTGGSLPVDAAVNQTIQAATANGLSTHPISDAKITNELANDANAALTTNSQTTDPAAGPSAGSAAGDVGAAPPKVLDPGKSSEAEAISGNGLSDTANLTEIAADDVSMQGSADLSLHSDTEGSKGDALESKGDDKHHVRTNSVKKPATFSKVSVTKNFMAKSATPTPTASKLGDRPSPVGTPPTASSAAKPRLIAKSGTALRDVQKSRVGSDTAGGPDASKVWNKNRPTAPPPPKHFTDEELKQQFGIHMATRLQSDENGKDAKWADIDDEEDDWAPEAVVWMDGTKSTLTAQEAAAPPAEQKAPTAPAPKPLEGARPTLAPKKPLELGPQKTILKPGAGAAAAQARQNGSGAGTPTEKPSLKAKSPAPTPAKSPWAVLPPVDKVSPINPPVQQAQPHVPFASQDARAYETAPPAPPAREITADTFDRSWREGEGAPRELFNAANGRYEPAPDGRRASKPDGAYRKPSVLQRPSFGAPAEPSAAFQSRTTAQMDGSGPRRRGSSVSQGSAPAPRRISMSKPQDVPSDRRPSMVVGHDMRTSPRTARNEPVQPPAFAQQSAWQQQMPPQPEGETEVQEDPVKVQERIMREKRELAKKRREEQEAKEEAEKQERLRARLEQLAGAGKSRKEREAEAAAAASSAQTTPATELPNQPHLTAPKGDQPEPAKPTETATIAAPILEAQTFPSAPSPAKSQQQPQPSPEEKLPSPLPTQPPSSLPDRPVSSVDQNQRQQTARAHLSPRANARVPFQQQAANYRTPASSYSSPGDRKQQPFARSPFAPSDPVASAWPTTAPNGNVWGTSGIGNGTFESASSFAPMPMSQQNSSLPPPPGMSGITRPSTSTRISPQGITQESRSPSLQQSSVAEPSHRAFAPPGLDSRPDPFAQQARANGASPAPGLGRQTHLPGPIAPPSRAQPPQQAQPTSRPDPLSAWNNAAQRLPYEYKNQVTTEVKKESAAPREDIIKETFKKTTGSSGRLGGPRKYDATEYTVHDGAGSRSVSVPSPAPPVAQTQPAGPFSTASPLPHETRKTTAENTVRIPDGSLNPAHGGGATPQPPIGPPNQQRATSSAAARGPELTPGQAPSAPSAFERSPPPPEEATHPVYSGSTSHPLVKLPSTHPKPIVRLPPASPQQSAMPQQPNQVSMPHRPISTWGAPPGSKPLVMQEAWQARFNGLFARTPIQTETPPSPPKTPPKMQVPAAAVTSSTRAAMNELPTAMNAIVSLPQHSMSPKANKTVEGFTIDDSQEITSKDVIENMFRAELSFGSKPAVTVPRNPTYGLAVYTPLKANAMYTGSSPPSKTAETQSVIQFNMRDVHPVKHTGVFVSLPQLKDKNGNKLNKLAFYPKGRQGSTRYNKGVATRNGNAGAPPTGPASMSENRKTSFQAQKMQGPAPATTATSPNNGPSKRGGAYAKQSRGNAARRPAAATPS